MNYFNHEEPEEGEKNRILRKSILWNQMPTNLFLQRYNLNMKIKLWKQIARIPMTERRLPREGPKEWD